MHVVAMEAAAQSTGLRSYGSTIPVSGVHSGGAPHPFESNYDSVPVVGHRPINHPTRYSRKTEKIPHLDEPAKNVAHKLFHPTTQSKH